MVNVDGRMVIKPKKIASGFSDWIPICEKNMLFELTSSFLLTPDAPGIPKPIKLQEQMRPFVDLKAPLNEEAGKKMAEWAKGGAAQSSPQPKAAPPSEPAPQQAPEPIDDGMPSEVSIFDHELRHCARTNQAINDVWRQIPEHLRQDLYATYSAQLKGLKGKA